MSQTLNNKISGAVDLGLLKKDIPDRVTRNLAAKIKLRPYQVTVLERFLYYIEDFPQCPTNPQLLFHMATGSGKTVLMAALILDLYWRGHRNFMFFVNSAQIIEKTKENFLNPASAKYLFAPMVRIDDKPVDIRAVDTFDAASDDAINIHFTTIQGLHTRMQEPKENSVTLEDFQDRKMVMISDEAHHLNAETKKTLTKGEVKGNAGWEGTVAEIFCRNPENMLLEFTATVDLNHAAIREKYHDKILFDYSLRQFREDGFSKDIHLRRADLPPERRMMQAMVLSQYRRKVAEAHGLHCKPVILMKSRTINESSENEAMFSRMVTTIDGETIKKLREASQSDDTTLRCAFEYIFDQRKIGNAEFALELQGDFAPDKVINVNKPEDLETQQIALNTLEDRSNELRVIFAVDKLNEGWDVLNLFDIVRLYNTHDGKANKVGKTTMAEAQLIGRGARYYPFVAPDQSESAPERRKFDKNTTHRLRILEELHYHCSHDPNYIYDIRNALRETGMLDEHAKTVKLKLKDSFKKTKLYRKGHVYVNKRKRNARKQIDGLNAYGIERVFSHAPLMTGQVVEGSAFGQESAATSAASQETVSCKIKLIDFGSAVLRRAMDANPFFHFNNLYHHFPHLVRSSEFITSEAYLRGVSVEVRGLPEDLKNLTAHQKLEISRHVLRQIESQVKNNDVEFVGSEEFYPHRIKDLFTDKTIKLPVEGEAALSWAESCIDGLRQINLSKKDWYAYDDSYGTDQEKHFIRYLNDQARQLHKRYDDFYLLRNEKAVKLYAFHNGQGFEPDFVLFLRKTRKIKKKGKKSRKNKMMVLQLFIEPKGGHLREADAWKQEFLLQIKKRHRLENVVQGRDYTVYGLPFFNEEGQSKARFSAEFAEILKDLPVN